ncbi:MAG: hypothetical protein ABI464_13685 [Chthoniobacteraceae bacterium]
MSGTQASPPVFHITAPRNEVSRPPPCNGTGGNHQHDADDDEQLAEVIHAPDGF